MPFPYAWVKLNQSGDAERTVTPRAGHTLTPIRNAYVEGFFLFGGMDGRRNDQGNPAPNSDLFVLKLGARGECKWSPIELDAASQVPPARTLHSALATSADEIFIWGGIHSAMPFQTLQDGWILDTSCMEWKKVHFKAAPTGNRGSASRRMSGLIQDRSAEEAGRKKSSSLKLRGSKARASMSDRAGSISFSSLAGAATRAVADRRGSSRSMAAGPGSSKKWHGILQKKMGMMLSGTQGRGQGGSTMKMRKANAPNPAGNIMTTSEEQFHEELVAMVSQGQRDDGSAADPNAPPPRSNHTTCLHENSVVLFGGHGGVGYQRKPFNDTWVLNLDNQRWTELACHGNPPPNRSGHQAFAKDGCVYIFGGWNNEQQFNDLFMLDIENKDWSDVDLSWGVPRWNCSLQLVEAIPSWRVFVFGGTADVYGEGRTGGVFDNKIGVLDMGEPMRWGDPSLEMRAEDAMPQAREHSAICYDPEESRLVIFGGWANKWLDDVWQINVSSIVGPPYAITKVEPPLGPVTGQMKVTIYGVGFQSTNGMVIIEFSSGKLSATTQGNVLNDEVIECLTPSVAGTIGPKDCQVKVQIGPRDFTTTVAHYSYFLNSIAEKSLCFGPGILQEQQANAETRFMIQARNQLGENRKSGRDEFMVTVQQKVLNAEGKEVLRDVAFELNDLNDGKTEVKYMADEGELVIHVKLMDENGKPRPIRGSPFRPTLTKMARNRANEYSGPVVTAWLGTTLKSLDEFYQTTNTGHQTKLKEGDVMNLIKVMNHIKDMYDQEDTLILRQDEVVETLAQLEREGLPSDKQLKQLKKIGANLVQLKQDIVAKEKEIQPMVQKESEFYKKGIADFENELKTYQGGLKKEAYYFYKSGLELAQKRLQDVTTDLDNFDKRMDDLLHIATSFNYPEELNNSKKIMVAMREDVANCKGLWEFEVQRIKVTEGFLVVRWGQVVAGDMEDEIKALFKKLKEVKVDRKCDAFVGVQDVVKKWTVFCPLVGELRDPAMRQRHWAQLMDQCGKSITVTPEILLRDMWNLELHKNPDFVEDTADQAKQEMKMENTLKKLQKEWAEVDFGFDSHRGTEVMLMKMADDKFEMLEEHQVQVQNMFASSFLSTFETEVVSWQKTLANISEVSTLLSEVQRSWVFLENLFIFSDEVKKELPEESDKFVGIDMDVKEILMNGYQIKAAKEFCNQGNIFQKLEKVQGALEMCQKALNDFMDSKKRAFPRFYFMSSNDLLDVLSNGNQPAKVIPQFPKFFIAIDSYNLEFPDGEDNRPHAVGMNACVGKEYVPFPEPLPLLGKVESYLDKCIEWFQKALKHFAKQDKEKYFSEGCMDDGFKCGEFIASSQAAQCALLVQLITWVMLVENGFAAAQDGKEDAVHDAWQESHRLLLKLIEKTMTNLDKPTRQKIMCAITLDAHTRDVQERLVQEKVTSKDAFQWQSMLKCYWKEDVDDASMEIADAKLPYGYEYLGNGPRLVVTPLTDRIYVTATQALHLCMGCAPAGPAGTGKTESTKDLANAVAKAISTNELYGFVNMQTREWKDGIISKVMRDLGQIPDTHPKWIMLDGDLDANWIESMNSVMDDNRLLTLPSNERIPLKVHMKMIFEIRDLNYATPATATRAGIVCMDDTFGVQWRSYVKSWIKKQEHPDNIKDQLWNFFEKCGASTTIWMLKNVKILVPMVDICLISACCSLLDNLLSPATYESLEYWFMFCFTAACGLCLAEVDGVDYRKNFSNWWKGEMKSVKYPSKGGIFDYYVKDAKFEEWSTAVETLEYSSETPMGEVTVTTNETYAMSYLMKALIEQHHPVMLIGLAGCGKTQSCLGLLKSLPPDVFTYYAMNMSYYTDSTLLQTMMENPLEKKAGKLYAPPGKLQLIYFVDDLNMPALDKYNTQSAIELMKQKQDYGHWYDRQKILVKDIGNTQYLCCMNPTAGSFIVNQRLQRHFWCCAVPFPEQSALLTIYSTFMKGHFERLPFKGPVQEQVSGIIKAALSLHSMVVSNFRKTASNFHYEFNIRHMSGVFSGLLQAKPGEFAEAEKVVLLWIHESERIYGDRLVSPQDLKKYRALAADLSKKMFGKFNFAKYFQEKNPEPLVFAPFSKGIQEMDGGGFYDKIPSTERLSQLLGEALREYNENNAAMDLVLFNDAMCHVGKICRIITSTPGHPLLVGVGGSGRQSLSRLSSYTCLYQTMMIVISGSYGMNDLKADLQAMYTKAGVKDEGVLFLFTDGQITNEKFLVFINDLLASGDIADLYASDEKAAIRNGVRSGCKGAGIQNLWSFFISRIRKNLHMSLCFSPVGDAMRNRARKFPALVNCTVIDWFQPWPMDALYNVGAKFLEPIEQLGPLDSPVRLGIMDFLPFSFEAAGQVATTFMNVQRRFAYTTPKSFLELIKLYTSMVGMKVDALEDQKDRLTNGLEKLRATSEQVAGLEEELKEKAVVVAEKAAAADVFAKEVGEKKATVEEESAKAAVEAEKCAKIAKDVSIQQADCEKDLAAAIPLVEQAEKALDVLDKKDFQELKALAKPPGGVDLVCEAAMHLQAGYDENIELDKKGFVKDPTWKGAQKMMNNPEKFLQNLKGFKSYIDDGKVPQQNVEKARKIQTNMGDEFSKEGMSKKSSAAAGLCVWIINIIMYYDVVVQVEPKRNALREATDTLNAANTKLAEVKELVQTLETNLAALMKEFDKAMAEKSALMADAEKCQNKLNMAQRLVGALAANGVIWEQTVENAGQELVFIPGDTLVACSYASYVGVFTRQYREDTVDAFVQYLTKKGVPLGPKPDPLAVLATDAEMAAWAGQGLPSDRVSCENGAILCNSQRWSLIIDPQLQGIVWIKNRESDNGLQVTRMGHSKMLSTFEMSLDQGKPVLIENMGEGIDAVIMPVVSRNTIKRGNKRVVKLGDKEIVLNNSFKLFMQTKLSNPHYPPEIQAECTIINFTVTEDGLEDQLLFLVVKLERPDLAKKKSELIKQQNEFKVTLAHLEALLLEKLANAEGDILDDTELILSLEEAKKTSDEVKEKVVVAQETELKINETSEFYRPTGARGSLLFFQLMSLCNMHTFYKYSLDAYLMVVTRAVNSVTLRKPKEVKEEPKVDETTEAEGGEDEEGDEEDAEDEVAEEAAPEEEEEEEIIELTGKELKLRVDLLQNIITLFVWNYTRRGLLDSDKLTVVSMMCMNILVRAGKITAEEKETLIRCPPDPTPPVMPENARSWLSETQWAQLKTLENMEAFKKGGQLTQNIEQDSLGWKRWYSEEKAENADLPRSARDLNQFQRLFLLRVMRQDRIGAALSQFVIDNLGQDFVEQPPFDMEASLEESTAITPFFFVLFPGVDPTPTIEALGRKLGKTEANGQLLNISMGQGQEKIALNALNKMAKEGGWIMLQNIHLMQAWLKDLERALEVIEEFVHDDFRCFLTSEPPGAMQGKLWDLIPEPILQRCIKVADEAPSDLKSNLRRAYSKFSQENIDACLKPREFKATLFALCFFHSLISGRIKFGAQGWSKKYPFNDGDLTICGQVLRNYLNNAENLGTEVPWPDLRYIFGEIMYGGHITDPWDRRVNNTYLAVLVTPELLVGGSLAPGFKSPDATKLEYSHYVKYIEERFPPEVPQMFGLHPNAEIGFLTNQGISIFKTIAEITGGGGGGGSSDISASTPLITSYLSSLPTNLDMIDIRGRLKEEDYTPFIIVSLQEADRVNGLLDQIRSSLLELELGISGALNVTEKMEMLSADLQANKVNALWAEKAYPSLKALSAWFADFVLRHEQVVEWTAQLKLLKSIWISGLFNSMSFLTSNMQVAARSNSLPLDYMTNRCRFYNTRDLAEITGVPAQGVNVHGLFLEGAGWEDGKGEDEGYITESKMKDLHPSMPVCNIFAVHINEMDWNAMYHCPVFSTSLRGATFIFQANVRMDPDDNEYRWVLAGAAMLTQAD